MRPQRIILVRSGSSQAERHPELHAETPDHLLDWGPQGRSEVEAVGESLFGLLKGEAYGLYRSPYLRSRRASTLLAGKLGPPVFESEDPRLRGMDYGWPREEAEARLQRTVRSVQGEFYYRFPQGESLADVYDRASSFIETLHRHFLRDDFPPNLLLVTHRRIVQCIRMRWFHRPVDEVSAMLPRHATESVVFCLNPASGHYEREEIL